MKTLFRRLPLVFVLVLMITPVLTASPVTAQPVTATLQVHREDASAIAVIFPAGQFICLDIALPEGFVYNQCFSGIHPDSLASFELPYTAGFVYTATIQSNTTACSASLVQPVMTVSDATVTAYMELLTDCPPTPPPFTNATVQIHREDASGAVVSFPAGEQICIGMNWTIAGAWQQCFTGITDVTDSFIPDFPYDAGTAYTATLDSDSTACAAVVSGPTISGSGPDTVLYLDLRTTCPESYYVVPLATVQIHRQDTLRDEFIFADGGAICLWIPFPESSGFEQCFTSMFSAPDFVQPDIPYMAGFDYTALVVSNTSGCEVSIAAPSINSEVTPPVIAYVLQTTCPLPPEPTPTPTATSGPSPTPTPTEVPGSSPTAVPTVMPGPSPTAMPTTEPPDPPDPVVSPVPTTAPVLPGSQLPADQVAVTSLPSTGDGWSSGTAMVMRPGLIFGFAMITLAFGIRFLKHRP